MNYSLETFLPPTPPIYKESLNEVFIWLGPSQSMTGCGCREPPPLQRSVPASLGDTGCGLCCSPPVWVSSVRDKRNRTCGRWVTSAEQYGLYRTNWKQMTSLMQRLISTYSSLMLACGSCRLIRGAASAAEGAADVADVVGGQDSCAYFGSA